MAFYSTEDRDFWDETTPPKMRYMQDIARGSGFDLAALPLGDPVTDNPPMMILLKFPPHGVVPCHAHDCHRVELLMSGTLTTPDGSILKPGAVMISGPGEFYGPNVAGPEGALTAEIFSESYARVDYRTGTPGVPSSTDDAMERLAVEMQAARASVS